MKFIFSRIRKERSDGNETHVGDSLVVRSSFVVDGFNSFKTSDHALRQPVY